MNGQILPVNDLLLPFLTTCLSIIYFRNFYPTIQYYDDQLKKNKQQSKQPQQKWALLWSNKNVIQTFDTTQREGKQKFFSDPIWKWAALESAVLAVQ